MRYYNFVLGTNSNFLKENSRIICFLAYREEESNTYAAFSFDENMHAFRGTYDYIMEMLNDGFLIQSCKVEPFEITMSQFVENLVEGQRRDYTGSLNRIVEAAHLWFYSYYCNDPKELFFTYDEKIIDLDRDERKSLYDDDFWNELLNIKNYKNQSDYSGNMVHYVISARSIEAASDLTSVLMKNLFLANRLCSRRMEIISEIDPWVYSKRNHLEEIIENNRGGAVIFDLSEKFGKDPVDYAMTAKYIENLFKKYRNHCLFVFTYNMDNPGTAKTTVVKLFGGIAKEKGILKSGSFVEYGGMDLDGLGCVYKIGKAFQTAQGGVLFIDEAYSMKSDTAVSVLIQEMENQRDKVIVILAGYNERMKSRVPHWVEFPDYTADELIDIFKLMMQERGFSATDDAIKEAHYIFDKVRITDNFGNGKYVRNLFEQAAQNQAVRLLKLREQASDIRKQEMFLLTKEDIASLNEGLTEERAIGTAKEELEAMIGLSSVKAVINKAIANYKLNKLCMERGIAKNRSSLHMVFTGNPGTAKTTVARLFAEIMKDKKVLSTGTFVEVGRADLVGDHVGATAKLVKRKFKEDQGGVLFVDEAYSFCDSYEHEFGDEAINTLVLDRNSGMLSRIAFRIEFEDYSLDELCEITKLMLRQKQMMITDAAMDKLRSNYENAMQSNDYGNGRFVRKMLEEAEMNLAERILKLGDMGISNEIITTIEEADICAYTNIEKKEERKIGFAC